MSRLVCAACGTGFPSSLAPTPTQTLELTNILRSNTVPPEVASFQATISAAPDELARHDAEIEWLRSVLGKLISDRDELAQYADRCRTVLSPIRRVPTELWATIFDMCSPCAPDGEDNLSDTTTPEEEVNRLSQWHLLQLSQVSSLWHKIAMGTPKLWSKIVVDTSLWNQITLSPAKLLSLLNSSLKRGGNHPLTMEIGVWAEDPQPHATMILLSQHASRWKDVYFFSDLESTQLLADAKGNLDRLEKLHVFAEWKGVDIFQIAPRLTNVRFSGHVENVPDLPWSQIRRFTYASEAELQSFTFLSLLGRCQNIRTFLSRITLLELPIGMTMPFVSSDVENLIFQLDVGASDTSVVGLIFDTLTLPSLKILALRPLDDGIGSPPVWHADKFLSLADRSSFHHHLSRLEINAIIQDQGLLRCLAVLPGLEDLLIYDCTSNGDHVVITDTLLEGLIRRVDRTTLAPKLELLSFKSRLAFTDSLYRDLIISRLPMAVGDLFDAQLRWLPDRRRKFTPELFSDVPHFAFAGDFYFESGPASA
ncbi:hypothetical protein DFH06DRAFT_378422 [Mycena polygramma]|nr:hypothetical protein DFH06DRAFT_378422 [Mycena polygramma]